jgi:hypothetical protein
MSSAAGGSSLAATGDNRGNNVSVTMPHVFGASNAFASKGARDPLMTHEAPNVGGARFLAPTKEAVAAVSEEAARAMGGGGEGLSSLGGFAGNQAHETSPNSSQLVTHGGAVQVKSS